MNLNEKHILQAMKDLRLSEKERALMRSELSAYADLHSMPSAEASSFNSLAFLGNIFAHSRVLIAGALALVLVVTGSSATASAAEKAVPGEALYGVKVLVNEPIASVFAGAGVSKARHHAKLAVRRVSEAEVLAARGALTAEREADLAERFIQEAEKAEAEVARLESKGDASASLAIRTELATDLSIHLEEPVAESALALAKSSEAATASMKVSVEEATDTIIDEKKIAFREIVATRVAYLRERATPPQALAIFESEDVGDAQSETADAGSAPASSALLSGSSVAASDMNASTTASSSPVEGKRLLRTLLRVHQSAGGEDGAGVNELLRGAHTGEASSLLGPVENPSRLVPRPTLPSE